VTAIKKITRRMAAFLTAKSLATMENALSQMFANVRMAMEVKLAMFIVRLDIMVTSAKRSAIVLMMRLAILMMAFVIVKRAIREQNVNKRVHQIFMAMVVWRFVNAKMVENAITCRESVIVRRASQDRCKLLEN
jgi:hypothetical protein